MLLVHLHRFIWMWFLSHQILLYRRWPFFWAQSIFPGKKHSWFLSSFSSSVPCFFGFCRCQDDRQRLGKVLPATLTLPKNRLVGRERLSFADEADVFFLWCVSSLEFPNEINRRYQYFETMLFHDEVLQQKSTMGNVFKKKKLSISSTLRETNIAL